MEVDGYLMQRIWNTKFGLTTRPVLVRTLCVLGIAMGGCNDKSTSPPGVVDPVDAHVDLRTPDVRTPLSDTSTAELAPALPDAAEDTGPLPMDGDVGSDGDSLTPDVATLPTTVCPDHDEGTFTLLVKPFLQLASPESVTVVWETEEGQESRLEWGETESFNHVECGTTFESWNGTQIHAVTLGALMADTSYHYRVLTGQTPSSVYRFRTPPTPESETDFRLAAMSDMQRDGGNPMKFHEVIHEGVMDYLAGLTGEDITESLGLVMVPGDLVDNGWVYDEWRDDFFGPAADLMARVPFYPVPGNHEGNTPFFFDYFHLPDNGTPGWEEHWWTHDYSNVRVVGLDSNDGYRVQEQLDWLDGVLDATCTDAHVDFVFAQLHHPHKSELWIAGEIDFTGDVIARLEAFSTQCGKPSIHFFGHTHGYSRGQSRDHSHLWVNVASAGGNIDYWGEYAQVDYPEFSVSTDDWGFVVMDVQAGDDPAFQLRRISRGNENEPLDNVVSDLVDVRLQNTPPEQPVALPVTTSDACSGPLILAASPFEDPDWDGHGSTHWQVSSSCDDFTLLTLERWRQHENQYFGVDTQADDDLTDESVEGLLGGAYCYRVRYRDLGLVWSPWSEPMAFEVSGSESSPSSENLLTNAGAEEDVKEWVVTEGYLESLESEQCDGIAPYAGLRYFAVGGLCESAAYGEAHQEIVLSEDQILATDAGQLAANFGGYFANWSGDDAPAMRLDFRYGDGALAGQSETIGSLLDTWVLISGTAAIPAGTRIIDAVIMGTRYVGTDNDSYLDDLFVETWECASGG